MLYETSTPCRLQWSVFTIKLELSPLKNKNSPCGVLSKNGLTGSYNLMLSHQGVVPATVMCSATGEGTTLYINGLHSHRVLLLKALGTHFAGGCNLNPEDFKTLVLGSNTDMLEVRSLRVTRHQSTCRLSLVHSEPQL